MCGAVWGNPAIRPRGIILKAMSDTCFGVRHCIAALFTVVTIFGGQSTQHQTPKSRGTSAKSPAPSLENQCTTLLADHREWLGPLGGTLITLNSISEMLPSSAVDIAAGTANTASFSATLSSGKTETFYLAPDKDRRAAFLTLGQRWDMFRAKVGLATGKG